MSLYLGNQKVGVSYREENPNVVDNETMAELNDAVGYRVGDFNTRTIPQMIEKLKERYLQERSMALFPQYHSTPWVRPQGWPDLDSLNLQMEGNDFIYMTYDNTKGRAAIALHIEKVTNGANIVVEMGHISNGEYIVDETITGSSNNYVRWFTSSDDDYPVVRVTGDIKYCYCYSITQDGATQHYRRQPILERISYVPHLISLCTSYTTNAWGQFVTQREVFNNGNGNALTSLYYAWAFCRDLEELDISGLKTQNVTDMQCAFRALLKFTSLDLRHFNVEKVKNFSNMFNGCRALQSINLTGWNTLAATNLGNMFDTCLALEEIKGIENFNTTKVTSLSSMFSMCRSLKSINLKNWNTENNTTLNNLFANCWELEEIDLSNWAVGKVTNLYQTFNNCYNLKRIYYPTGLTAIITSTYSMFSGCNNLQYIDLSWFNITSSCTSICYMFSNCWSIKKLNIPSTWDVSGISSSNNNGHSVFNNCYSLKEITGIKNWNFQHTNSITTFFNNCYSLTDLDVSGWNVSTITNLSSCFTNCFSLKTLDLSNWNPENCTTFSSMFSGCYSLTEVGDISEWDTSNCTAMGSMFRYCYSLKQMPAIQTWDLSKVTSIGSIFSECTSLETVTWTDVNLPVCTNIDQLFKYDYNLKYINLSRWSVPVAAYSASYYHTLGSCWQLRDVIGFPIPSSYKNLGFQDCENLSYDSLMLIVNSLPQVTDTHTLRIPAVSLNLLTTTEKAIATNKGWTLANS